MNSTWLCLQRKKMPMWHISFVSATRRYRNEDINPVKEEVQNIVIWENDRGLRVNHDYLNYLFELYWHVLIVPRKGKHWIFSLIMNSHDICLPIPYLNWNKMKCIQPLYHLILQINHVWSIRNFRNYWRTHPIQEKRKDRRGEFRRIN